MTTGRGVSVRDPRPSLSARAREAGRPSISPMWWAAVAAWAGARAGTELALYAWMRGDSVGLAPLVGVLMAGVVVAALSWRRSGVAVAVLAAVAAFGSAAAQADARAAIAQRLESAAPAARVATVVGDAREGAFGTTIEVRLDGLPINVVAKVPKDVVPPVYGRRITLCARLRTVPRRSPGAADAFRAGTLLRASPWRLTDTGWGALPLGAVARWRYSSVRALRAAGPGSELVSSMLFGTKIPDSENSALLDARTAGVAWAVSASGMHLAALLLLADRWLALAGCSRRGRAVGAVVLACALALGSGLKPSFVRAALMAGGVTVARAAGRRRDTSAALGAAVVVMLAVDPTGAYDTGLLLGATAVSAIALFSVLARTWAAVLMGRRSAYAVGASLTAQAAVAPLSAALFGGVALLGPVALIVTGPIVELAVMLAFAGCVVHPLVAPAGAALMLAAAAVARAAAAIWRQIARLPSAFVPVAGVPGWIGGFWLAGAAVLWLRWPMPRRALRARVAVASLLVLSVGWSVLRPGVTTGVIALDVGQGDAILIRDGGHAVMVDTGPDPLSLRKAMARSGVRSLDGLVLTHAHVDHTGGIEGLAGVARPGWIGVPDVVDDDVDRLSRECRAWSDRIVRMHRDMTFVVGETRARVLWPKGGERLLDANDTSVILLLERRGVRAILLGDAEDRAQRGALDAWSTNVELVKVAHHGSPNGNVPDALELWRPRIALISVGAGNSFGHPSRAALDSLAAIGCGVHRTDLEGDVAFGWNGAVGRAQASAAYGFVTSPVCDNRGDLSCPLRDRNPTQWPLPTSAISNPSTSSTAPRSCFSSAQRSGCATAWPLSPISISTWTPLTGIPPPLTTS